MAKKQAKITEELDPIFEDDKNIMVYLKTSKLHHHPDNPRKDLGDLEELANSIKANGIMQNLTVVPRFQDDTYTVIIGNRRLEAAKLAELDEVPCVIVDMTPEEQLATMLLENMQRSDLTIYEQAQGFKQLMIDFGQSVEKISERTGFSQSTVRRRLKLAELDGDKLKKASEKQISLKDIERLNEIEDVEERNKLLDDIGTNNFEYRYNNALNEQKKKALIQKWREYLLNLGLIELDTHISFEEYEEINNERIFDFGEEACETLVSELDKGKTYYFSFSYQWVDVYEKVECTNEEDEELEDEEDTIEKNKMFEKRRAKIQDAFKNTYKLRRQFIFDYTEADAKKHSREIIEFLINLKWNDNGIFTTYKWHEINELLLLGLDLKKGSYVTNLPYDGIKPVVEATPFKALLTHVYCLYGDEETQNGYYNCEYHKNSNLEFLYKHLCALGYEMSDEEKALLDGTHELYLTDLNN